MTQENSEEAAETSLAQLIGRANLWFNKGLLAALEEQEFSGLSNADILMLANLNCGETYPSEVARRIGVTRQAVYKLLKNLEAQEIIRLEQDPKKGNSKIILITPYGETMIRASLDVLAELEEHLRSRLGDAEVANLRQILEMDWGAPVETDAGKKS